MDKALVVYRRERSDIWQCRFKVAGLWQRKSTQERDLKLAKERARELMITAEIRKRENLPVVSRKFRDVAKLAIDRMEREQAAGRGKSSFKHYIVVIEDYLIPILGNRSIANIDQTALDELDVRRAEIMGKNPTPSTIGTHNVVLNRVFDEAIMRRFLTDVARPKLNVKTKKSERRPAFTLDELRVLIDGFDPWIAKSRTEQTRELRELMRDYVDVLIDTGARPGDELMNVKWRQIKFVMKPRLEQTGVYERDDAGDLEEIELNNLNRSLEIIVSGKTGTRTIVAMNRTVKALERIAQRNYAIRIALTDPFSELRVSTNNDFVFCTRGREQPTSFAKMFDSYLKHCGLEIDPKTEKRRVFYSLRHTYATLALTYDRVPIHTLAKQMGTSVQMIEQHYSHLKVVEAIEQLRGEETRRLIQAGSVFDSEYKSNFED
ncbi:MAG: hypothetical protein WCP04_15130 [Pseudomonadota bacterium]